MNLPSRKERIEFWKFSYARSSFIQADLFARSVLSIDSMGALAHGALTLGIVTAYGRPFKQRQEVRLERDAVPPEHLPLHDEIIEIRDKIIAHRDLDGPSAAWGFVSQLIIRTDTRGFEVHTLSPRIEVERAKAMLPLLAELIRLMEEETKSFLGYLVPLPRPDEYVLSLDENPAQWLRPAED